MVWHGFIDMEVGKNIAPPLNPYQTLSRACCLADQGMEEGARVPSPLFTAILVMSLTVWLIWADLPFSCFASIPVGRSITQTHLTSRVFRQWARGDIFFFFFSPGSLWAAGMKPCELTPACQSRFYSTFWNRCCAASIRMVPLMAIAAKKAPVWTRAYSWNLLRHV